MVGIELLQHLRTASGVLAVRTARVPARAPVAAATRRLDVPGLHGVVQRLAFRGIELPVPVGVELGNQPGRRPARPAASRATLFAPGVRAARTTRVPGASPPRRRDLPCLDVGIERRPLGLVELAIAVGIVP